MEALTAPELPEATVGLCIAFSALIPCAAGGVALMNAGLGRSRSAAHAMTAALCAMAIAAIVFVCAGFALEGSIELPSHTVMLGGKPWNWAGAGPILLRGVNMDGSRTSLVILFQTLCAGLVAVIPLGAGADRWRLSAICASSALLACITLPLFAHWIWAGGWLAQLGVNYQLGRGFMDSGGSSLQVVGGLTALSMSWILGPRRGKYGQDGRSVAIPGHDAVLLFSGCFLAWIGWLGMNSAGAILFAGARTGETAGVVLNTTLAASSAALAAAALTRSRFGRPDASLTANGWLGGLVTSSAGGALIAPAEAIAIGLVGGVLVVLSVELLESRLSVDDPGGAVSIHAAGGAWGILAAGLFARFSAAPVNGVSGQTSGQILAQIAGLAALLGFILPATYFLNWLLNRVHHQRVSIEAEMHGLDLHELGAGAYPEFVTHSEDLTQRFR
jgi:Amt family ammonium transporter